MFCVLGHVGIYCSGSKLLARCTRESVSKLDGSKCEAFTLRYSCPFSYLTILLQTASFGDKSINFCLIVIFIYRANEYTIDVFQENFSLPGAVGDLAIGHALVLMQIDWPQEASVFTTIIERIVNRGSFSYPLFQAYIICIDILEELMYLGSEHGCGILLDITTGAGGLQSTYIYIDIF